LTVTSSRAYSIALMALPLWKTIFQQFQIANLYKTSKDFTWFN